MLQSDIDAYRTLMRRARMMASRPFYETQSDMERFSLQYNEAKQGIMTTMLTPAIQQCRIRAVKADALHAAAQIGLLAHRFQSRRGRGPESLEELEGEFFNRVLPTDPFSGKPLILKSVESGWDIYSIGLDMKDDGGAAKENGGETDDIVFHVQNHNQN